jgi:hypothetical protein
MIVILALLTLLGAFRFRQRAAIAAAGKAKTEGALP